MMWAVVLWGSLGCYLLKLGGYLLPQRLLEHPSVNRVTALVPIALLAALVTVLTIGAAGPGAVVDARALGVAVAGGLLLLRAPFPVVVFAAAATAAGLRALTG